ncbi:hypothetical protein [Paraburkholderia strydomiana]|uniref:hypothetical protein n=1 Tax=Paraburkholderia strydomiana TaxID=1245417 RepID=UPI001BEAF238|nr:hypothetical protein [Paraburkholderia strydomiana]MBT2794572.1 hypothetical protein [Paraburkholderia strydomiana]
MDNKIPQRLMHRRQQFFGQPGVLTGSPASCDADLLICNEKDRQPKMPIGSDQMGMFINKGSHAYANIDA